MERIYYLGFSCFSGIGPVRFGQLLKRFGSAKNAWGSSTPDLKEVLGEALVVKFDKFRLTFNLKAYEQKLKDKEVEYLILSEKNYPPLLSKTPKAPIILYIKGHFDFLSEDNQKAIGVVGARKTTSYGREVTKSFVGELVSYGFTIVSGLAIGVDTVAAQTAVENNGKTIAVLGSGVDVCHPSSNKNLYEEIIKKGGVIVSEVPLGQQPTKGLFPARNRIIAGLSLGVLVTEGTEDSGSLITAEEAFKINRPVFAVPGPITSSLSKGPYKLIQKGAKLVTNSNDILNEISPGVQPLLGVEPLKQKFKKGDTKEEQKIIDLLQNESMAFDQIVRLSNFTPSKTGAILSILEVKGFIKNNDGKYQVYG